MKPLNILILTDHRAHSKENSLYNLGKEIRLHPYCSSLHIASRGLEDNHSFFYDFDTTEVGVLPIQKAFNYQKTGRQFKKPEFVKSIHDYDFIILRLPRPIPDGFFAFLESVYPANRIINQPSGIEETSSKAYMLNFEKWCPPMKLCRSLEDIKEFHLQFPVVLKPIESYGGQGILKIENNQVFDKNNLIPWDQFIPIAESQLKQGGYLAMKYLKNVGLGDKRIVVVNGEVIGASLRLPAQGSWLCNALQGGSSHRSSPDSNEIAMVIDLHSKLSEKGIIIFGMDTLVADDGQRVLSEVNTLSVGGIKQLAALSKKPLVRKAAHIFMDYMLENCA